MSFYEQFKYEIEDVVGDLGSKFNTGAEYYMKMVDKIHSEKHRHYHTLEHMWTVYRNLNEEGIATKKATLLFALMHDLCYSPLSTTNEEDSIQWVKDNWPQCKTMGYFAEVCDWVMGTKDISNNCIVNECDRYSVLTNDVTKLIEYFNKIWKEYQAVDLITFKQKHWEIFTAIRESHSFDKNVFTTSNYKSYINEFMPSVGLYVGSFNPIHIGHLHIIEEAEKVFDKVIVAHGVNESKSTGHDYSQCEVRNLPIFSELLNYREAVDYNGTLVALHEHYVKQYKKVTFVRGIRNSDDLASEMTMYRILKDQNPDINIVYIPCAKGHEHISSSSIRKLKQMGLPISMYAL